MSSWTIVHPDTLGYHAQTIQWIEKYKAVPGLVHLHARFGYQGLWFVDNALFGFSFTGVSGFTFLNSTVLFWFFIFILNRVNYNFFQEGKKIFAALWMGLLLLTMWSYTQVRLTATSASPDFIAAIFILAIIYLLIEKNTKHLSTNDWLLASFLSLVALTIKLSTAPMLLITAVSFFLLLKNEKIKLALIVIIISALTLTPFITRNIITTGYIVFPLTALNIVNVDWKYSSELTESEKNYISAYAKKQGVDTKEEIDSVNKMSPAEWLPIWWQQRSAADKTIMFLLPLCFIIALLSLKKILRSGFITLLVLITLITGIIFWFLIAPDPRFGFGQILGFISVITYLAFKKRKIMFPKNGIIVLLVAASIIVLFYTGYRFINFFERDQWLTPLGIKKTRYITFDCDGLKINTPSESKDFGIIPVPCTDLKCDEFSPRGKKITDGFKAKQNP